MWKALGDFPLAADRSLTNVVSTLSHRGSGGREGQGDRVSGREREQLGVSECSGTTVSGRSIHIHFTPLTRASRAHLLTLFSSPRGAESSCGWVRVIGLVHVAWAASSIRAAIARARCPWCWGGSTAVAQVSVAGVLSSGRRCVSTVFPRRWVDCGVLDTGTNARFRRTAWDGTAVVRARCQLQRGRYGWACVGGYRHTSCDGVELARPLSRGGPCDELC